MSVGSFGCTSGVSFTSLNFPRGVWFPVQGVQSTGRAREGKACVWWIFYLLSLKKVNLGKIYTAQTQQEMALLSSVAAPWMLSY